jgi:hypothetical protein
LKEQCAISKEDDGSFLYFYNGKQKLSNYFITWKIITKMTWKYSLILLGDQYVNSNPNEGLFLANDHDVASAEDAFINGMYTASLVMKK